MVVVSFAMRPLVPAVCLLVGIAGYYLAANSLQKPTKTTQEFIDFLSAEAVKDADMESHIHLDYTVESIKKVEEVLSGLHGLYAKDHSSVAVNALAMAYGAYIGEVIRKTEPNVRWEKNDSINGEKSPTLIWAGWQSYPMAWCYRRIINGDEDNIWTKYQALKERASQKESKPQPSK